MTWIQLNIHGVEEQLFSALPGEPKLVLNTFVKQVVSTEELEVNVYAAEPEQS